MVVEIPQPSLTALSGCHISDSDMTYYADDFTLLASAFIIVEALANQLMTYLGEVGRPEATDFTLDAHQAVLASPTDEIIDDVAP